jgi:hypothetical protein
VFRSPGRAVRLRLAVRRFGGFQQEQVVATLLKALW